MEEEEEEGEKQSGKQKRVVPEKQKVMDRMRRRWTDSGLPYSKDAEGRKNRDAYMKKVAEAWDFPEQLEQIWAGVLMEHGKSKEVKKEAPRAKKLPKLSTPLNLFGRPTSLLNQFRYWG